MTVGNDAQATARVAMRRRRRNAAVLIIGFCILAFFLFMTPLRSGAFFAVFFAFALLMFLERAEWHAVQRRRAQWRDPARSVRARASPDERAALRDRRRRLIRRRRVWRRVVGIAIIPVVVGVLFAIRSGAFYVYLAGFATIFVLMAVERRELGAMAGRRIRRRKERREKLRAGRVSRDA